MAASLKPKSVEIRSYQVGFGDCFLLTFKYPGTDRNVLIDFGSMALPKGAGKNHMLRVADQIKQDCGGKLDIVVATHRHSDHVSGFATRKDGKAPGNVIASCKPEMVIQPWTENPKAPRNATEAELTAVRAFAKSLNDMHAVAAAAVDTARALRRVADGGVVGQLKTLGLDNIKNRSAVENLMRMGKNYYVKHGDKLPLVKLLPGVKVHVLGPPSLKQSGEIRNQRRTDAEEFWHLQARAGERMATDGRILFPREASGDTPAYARWFRRRLRQLRADMMLPIVRILDEQMNNTSVILLFEVGRKLLLFPGDAQIENWRYALSQKANTRRLRRVGVYKVGHHGSLNATPKTLWNLFANKGPAGKPGRLHSMLSTLDDVHGSDAAGTEVPRRNLVNALKRDTAFVTTQSLEAPEISRIVLP
jgi:hypothetical protein